MLTNEDQEIKLSFERLKRHYENAIHTYDEISLRDLSHSMRIWVEKKTEIDIFKGASKEAKVFDAASINKKLSRTLKNIPYIYLHLPHHVKTFAFKALPEHSGGNILGMPSDSPYDEALFALMVNPDGSLEMFDAISFLGKHLSQDENKYINKPKTLKCNYLGWLGSGFVYINYLHNRRLLTEIISREQIIKRMANEYGGSHSRLSDEPSVNKFSAPIKVLSNLVVGGIHLPYYLLISIAQDMVNLFPTLFDIEFRGRK